MAQEGRKSLLRRTDRSSIGSETSWAAKIAKLILIVSIDGRLGFFPMFVSSTM